MINGKDIDSKISFALERIFTAFRILFWENVKKTNLSPIQLQFILYLKNHPEEMRNISNIAIEFGLTKATVSDAINSLNKKRLVYKVKNKTDRRFVTLNLSKECKKLADALKILNEPLKEILKTFPENEKEKMLAFLIKFVDSLRNHGIIRIARMCLSCSNFKKLKSSKGEKTFFCEFTEKSFSEKEINVDCLFYKQRRS